MRKIFSIIFILILLSPTAVWLIHLDFGIKVQRLGLQPPRFDGRALFNNDYYRSFDQYVNDSFSLRSPLVFAKRWIDYHLFGATDAADVHVGSHGWLYSRQSIDDYRKEACGDSAAIEQLVLELHAIERIVEASGRRFIFTVAPNKSTIYPEFLGFVPLGESCNHSRYDLLLEKLERYPLKHFVRLEKRLQNAKQRPALLYSPTGTYWNASGALVAAETIHAEMIQVPGQYQAPGYLHGDPGDPNDLARRMIGFLTQAEDGAVIQLTSSGRPDRSTAIVYGDGYIKNLVPYLSQMLGSLMVIPTDSIPSKKHGEDLRTGDIILLARAESGLASIQLDVDKIFTTLEAEALKLLRLPIDPRAFVPLANVSLNNRAEGLEIKSVGDSSSFALMSIPGSDGHVFRVLKLIVEATQGDILTVDFMTDPPIVTRKPLRPGITALYLPLPFQTTLSLNINPGRKAGVLMLQSAEIYMFSDRPEAVEPRPPNNFPADEKILTTEINAGKLAAPITSSSSITLTDFENGRIFQRQGDSADIVISGTYSGEMAAVEARVVESNTRAEILPWTVIDASPQNGIFVGQLTEVPQGGWYRIQVRSQNDHTVFNNGKHSWGVGMLVACLGQSNMKEWFYTGDDLIAHSLLRKFSDSGWSKIGGQANAAIAFGNRLIKRLGIPVGLLDFAVNGSGLRKEADWGTGYWADTAPASIYNRFVAGVAAAGGAVEFVIWIQGEADAARGTVTEDAYALSLKHFIENQVRLDIANGSRREQLPFLVVMMIKRPGGKDEPHQAIRNGQKQVVDNVAECYLAATTLDLKNHGRQHLKPKAYISMGNRVAQTVLFVLGKEPFYRGPRVIHATRLDDRTVEIKIKHNGGDDFKPASGISGWEIITNGERIPVKDVYRHDAETIRIVAAHPLAENATVRYLYGAMPDATHPVLDNSPMSLPLEEYHSKIN